MKLIDKPDWYMTDECTAEKYKRSIDRFTDDISEYDLRICVKALLAEMGMRVDIYEGEVWDFGMCADEYSPLPNEQNKNV